MADVIIIDGPPILAVSEAAVLASMGLGVVFVVEAGETRTDAARLAQQALTRANAHILGVVLNKTRTQPSYYYKYYQRAGNGEAPGDPGADQVHPGRKLAQG
jgi:Mrp family chromosome partitioning ATPase